MGGRFQEEGHRSERTTNERNLRKKKEEEENTSYLKTKGKEVERKIIGRDNKDLSIVKDKVKPSEYQIVLIIIMMLVSD